MPFEATPSVRMRRGNPLSAHLWNRFTSFGKHWPAQVINARLASANSKESHCQWSFTSVASTWCQASFSLLFLKSYLCTWYLWYYTCNWNRVIQHSMIYLLLYILLKYQIEIFECLLLLNKDVLRCGYAPPHYNCCMLMLVCWMIWRRQLNWYCSGNPE